MLHLEKEITYNDKWLKTQQRNSWEPEVIISGISLAFIFTFPTQIYEFSAGLIQDYGLNYLGASVILYYISAVVNIFKIFLIVHLCLRFAWAGLLGLSYAFPHGVVNERLFEVGRDYEYSKPKDMVLKMEKVCSMAFALPLMFGILFILITLYLGFLLFLHKVFELNFFIIYLIFLFSTFSFSFWQLKAKKSKLKVMLNKSMFSNISAIYQSNLGKWSMLGYIFLIMGGSIPLVRASTVDFLLYDHEIDLRTSQLEWPNNAWYYRDLKDPEVRFSRAIIPSKEINGRFLPIHMAYYDDDVNSMKIIHDHHQASMAAFDWKEISLPTDIYRIFLNDSLISNPIWEKNIMEKSHQKAYTGLIDIQHLKEGIYTIRVEKLSLTPDLVFRKPELRLRKNWAKFNFIRV